MQFGFRLADIRPALHEFGRKADRDLPRQCGHLLRRSKRLTQRARFLAEQQPSSEVVAKLAELFVSQAVREYVDHLPIGASGWLRGLTDPAVTKALSIIHTRYAEELDVEGLAREAGVDVKTDAFDGVFHVWHFFAGVAPESDDAIARIAKFLDH